MYRLAISFCGSHLLCLVPAFLKLHRPDIIHRGVQPKVLLKRQSPSPSSACDWKTFVRLRAQKSRRLLVPRSRRVWASLLQRSHSPTTAPGPNRVQSIFRWSTATLQSSRSTSLQKLINPIWQGGYRRLALAIGNGPARSIDL